MPDKYIIWNAIPSSDSQNWTDDSYFGIVDKLNHVKTERKFNL